MRGNPLSKRLLCLLMAMLLLVTGLVSVVSLAAAPRIVKVAFFPMAGYHDRTADGGFDGMDVRYLSAVCEYTDWEIEYVPCDSWEEALDLVYTGQADLLGSAQYSAQRAERYLYANLSSGYTFGVIATNSESRIAYEDFSAMADITFGMVRGYVRQTEFLRYLADNGIHDPKVLEFDNTAALHQALADGEIDALVHTFTEVRTGQRLIGRFAPNPFYYITYQGNEDLMRQLNQAIADLKMNQPQLEANLMNEFYYDRFDKMVLLTTEEKNYLAEEGSFTVGYLDGHYPFSYEEDGEFRGLARDMLESGFAATGVTLDYRRMENDTAAVRALKEGDVDILAYYTPAADVDFGQGLNRAREYADVPLVLVMDKRGQIGEIHTVAATTALADSVRSSEGFSGAVVVYADTQEAGLQKVVQTEADAAVCNGYLAEYLFRTQLQYENLQIKLVLNSRMPVSAAVRSGDTHLAAILNKTLVTVDSRTINEYMMRENTYPLISLKGYIQEHSLPIILILLALLAGVVTAFTLIIRKERRIRRLMYKDRTMDIWNLNYLIYKGGKLLSQKQKQKRGYAAVYVTLPQFRSYNTLYGWRSGDQLLTVAADYLKNVVKKDAEVCARDRSDHFTLLLAFQSEEELKTRLGAIRKGLETRILDRTGTRMDIREGVRILPAGAELKTVIGKAEQALEFTSDRAPIQFYDDALEQKLKEQHEKEKLLESVDPNKDFVAYYQPKTDIHTDKVVGAEALVRFLNPAEGGRVTAPGFFVPYYEQTGKITEIDFFVYESACKLLRRRLDAGEKVVPISCNFSRLHFLKPDFVERFYAVLERYHLPRELIEMEITETLVLEGLETGMVLDTLKALDERHIRLSIDDFGSGYSSLGVFESIPASVVKLDRSFLLNQTNRDRQVSIMRGIVKLAGELKAEVVCEGVETEADVALMKEIGASIAQGYFYSKPIPEADFEQMLDEKA